MSNKEREDTSNNNSFSINHTLLFWCIIIFIVIVVAVYLGFNQIDDLRYHIMKVEMVAKNSLSNNQAGIPNMSENNLRAEIYSAAHEASESFVNHTGNLLTIFGIMLTIITAIICVLFPFLINKEQKEWMKQRLEKSEQDLNNQKETIEKMKENIEKQVTRLKEQREKYDNLLKSSNLFAFNMRQRIIGITNDNQKRLEHHDEYIGLDRLDDNDKIKRIIGFGEKGIADSKLYYTLGELYSNANKYEKACSAFQIAVTNNNEFVDAYQMWSDALKKQGKLQESWEKMAKAIYFNMDESKSQDLQNKQKEVEDLLLTPDSECKKTITVNNVVFTMILVKGGVFNIGETLYQEDKDLLQSYQEHKVLLDDYYIGETVVTQKLWAAIMGSNPSDNLGMNLPVESVSWDDANDFIETLNANPAIQEQGLTFALPTNAQWEYAARSGRKQDKYLYSGSDDIDEVAWYEKNSDDKTHPVKKKTPNQLGLYDMSGNIFEWCQDYWKGYACHDDDNWVNPRYNKEKDNYGLGRICRGGGFGSSKNSCRVTNIVNGHKSRAIGFRLVCTPTSSTL